MASHGLPVAAPPHRFHPWHLRDYMFMSQLIILAKGLKPNPTFTQTSGGGLHEMGKGSVRCVIASEGYLSDDEFRLHDMHLHDHVFITKKDEHVEEISMKQ